MATPTTSSSATLDLGRALRFVTEDPDWLRKILIGGLFGLLSTILIGIPFVAGYFVRIIRRTARGEPRPLPEWNDLGGIFGDGLGVVAISAGYFIAVAAIPAAIGCVMGVTFSGLHNVVGSRGSRALESLMAMGMFGLYAVLMLVLTIVYLYVPAALLRAALMNRLSAGFEVRENLALIRRNLVNYALVLLLYLVSHFAAQFGVILCCVGVFPLSFWATCLLGWGLGEIGRIDPVLAPYRSEPLVRA